MQIHQYLPQYFLKFQLLSSYTNVQNIRSGNRQKGKSRCWRWTESTCDVFSKWRCASCIMGRKVLMPIKKCLRNTLCFYLAHALCIHPSFVVLLFLSGSCTLYTPKLCCSFVFIWLMHSVYTQALLFFCFYLAHALCIHPSFVVLLFLSGSCTLYTPKLCCSFVFYLAHALCIHPSFVVLLFLSGSCTLYTPKLCCSFVFIWLMHSVYTQALLFFCFYLAMLMHTLYTPKLCCSFVFIWLMHSVYTQALLYFSLAHALCIFCIYLAHALCIHPSFVVLLFLSGSCTLYTPKLCCSFVFIWLMHSVYTQALLFFCFYLAHALCIHPSFVVLLFLSGSCTLYTPKLCCSFVFIWLMHSVYTQALLFFCFYLAHALCIHPSFVVLLFLSGSCTLYTPKLCCSFVFIWLMHSVYTQALLFFCFYLAHALCIHPSFVVLLFLSGSCTLYTPKLCCSFVFIWLMHSVYTQALLFFCFYLAHALCIHPSFVVLLFLSGSCTLYTPKLCCSFVFIWLMHSVYTQALLFFCFYLAHALCIHPSFVVLLFLSGSCTLYTPKLCCSFVFIWLMHSVYTQALLFFCFYLAHALCIHPSFVVLLFLSGSCTLYTPKLCCSFVFIWLMHSVYTQALLFFCFYLAHALCIHPSFVVLLFLSGSCTLYTPKLCCSFVFIWLMHSVYTQALLFFCFYLAHALCIHPSFVVLLFLSGSCTLYTPKLCCSFVFIWLMHSVYTQALLFFCFYLAHALCIHPSFVVLLFLSGSCTLYTPKLCCSFVFIWLMHSVYTQALLFFCFYLAHALCIHPSFVVLLFLSGSCTLYTPKLCCSFVFIWLMHSVYTQALLFFCFYLAHALCIHPSFVVLLFLSGSCTLYTPKLCCSFVFISCTLYTPKLCCSFVFIWLMHSVYTQALLFFCFYLAHALCIHPSFVVLLFLSGSCTLYTPKLCCSFVFIWLMHSVYTQALLFFCFYLAHALCIHPSFVVLLYLSGSCTLYTPKLCCSFVFIWLMHSVYTQALLFFCFYLAHALCIHPSFVVLLFLSGSCTLYTPKLCCSFVFIWLMHSVYTQALLFFCFYLAHALCIHPSFVVLLFLSGSCTLYTPKLCCSFVFHLAHALCIHPSFVVLLFLSGSCTLYTPKLCCSFVFIWLMHSVLLFLSGSCTLYTPKLCCSFVFIWLMHSVYTQALLFFCFYLAHALCIHPSFVVLLFLSGSCTLYTPKLCCSFVFIWLMHSVYTQALLFFCFYLAHALCIHPSFVVLLFLSGSCTLYTPKLCCSFVFIWLMHSVYTQALLFFCFYLAHALCIHPSFVVLLFLSGSCTLYTPKLCCSFVFIWLMHSVYTQALLFFCFYLAHALCIHPSFVVLLFLSGSCTLYTPKLCCSFVFHALVYSCSLYTPKLCCSFVFIWLMHSVYTQALLFFCFYLAHALCIHPSFVVLLFLSGSCTLYTPKLCCSFVFIWLMHSVYTQALLFFCFYLAHALCIHPSFVVLLFYSVYTQALAHALCIHPSFVVLLFLSGSCTLYTPKLCCSFVFILLMLSVYTQALLFFCFYLAHALCIHPSFVVLLFLSGSCTVI